MNDYRGWVPIVRGLCDYLELNAEKLSQLHNIDATFKHGRSVDVDEMFRIATADTCRILKLARGHVYVKNGSFLDLCTSTDETDAPLNVPASILELLTLSGCEHRSMISRSFAENSELIPWLGQAIYIHQIDEGNGRLFGVLVFESDHPGGADAFSNSDTVSHICSLATQISIALEFHTNKVQRFELSKTIDEFFRRRLKPTYCLQLLAKRVCALLPHYTPFRLDPIPESQILVKDSENALIIRGTTGKESDVTRVPVKKSITGLLFLQTSQPYICCDPTQDYPGLYRDYLGKSQGKAMRSELCVPLEHEGVRFAALNLESPQENAFAERHIEALCDVARTLSPVVYALNQRIEKSSYQVRGMAYGMDRYIETLLGQYSHKIKAPISAISTNLTTIEKKIKLREVSMDEEIGLIKESIRSILNWNDMYSASLTGFANFEPRPIADLLESAILLFRPDELMRENSIVLTTEIRFRPSVVCSAFIKEVFRNILDNALFWVGEKQKSNPGFVGEIVVMLEADLNTCDDEEIALNRFCTITFHDNGIGCSDEDIINVFEPGFTQRSGKGGSGFGLYSAREYISAIRGEIEARSKINEYFSITIRLPFEEMQNDGAKESDTGH